MLHNRRVSGAMQTVLIIKHGALGDIIMSLGPFQAIRRHHPDARLLMLTTRPFVPLIEATGWFDEVWVDPKPKLTQPGAWLGLVRRLRGAGLTHVYDLQRSDRTATMFRALVGRRPEWNGTVAGATHRYVKPTGRAIHIMDRERAQLALSGIADVPAPSFDWVDTDVARFDLPERYALIVPGCAPHRPEKRWPAAHFAAVGRWLAGQGIAPVLIGTAQEAETISAVRRDCPDAIDLGGATSLVEVLALARGAAAAVGNDTGPMHGTAAIGAPSLVVFSAASDPALIAPRGPAVAVMRVDDLATLDPDAVIARLAELTAIAPS